MSLINLVPLIELGEIVSGSTPDTDRKEYWENGDIPWITPADLTDHQEVFFFGMLRKITEEGYKSCSTRILPPGSILYSSRAPIGHCAVTTFPLCTNQGFKNLIPNHRLDSAYGYYALKYLTPQIMALGRGATFLEINKEIFENVKIPLPPLEEQRRIAEVLQKADRVRRLRRYARALSDGYLQSVFLEMFGDPETNPMGWKKAIIDDVISESQYGTSLKSNEEKRGYPVLGMANITYDGKIDLSSISYVDLSHEEFNKLKLEKGDVIFNRTNSTELVGKTAYWNITEDAVLASYLVKLKIKKNVTPDFFVGLLNTPKYKKLFRERCKKAVGQSNISPTLLREFPIIIPSLGIQEEYSKFLSSITLLQRRQFEATRQAEQLFQSLLREAFEG